MLKTFSDKGLFFNPLQCQYMDMNNSLVSSGTCMDTRTFMCRFGEYMYL